MKYASYYNKTFPSRGLTLIEVVCSLTLLATLLVVSLMAFSQHAQQVKTAQLRLEAQEATETLLASWLETDGIVPQEETGRFGTREQFVWRTDPVNQPEAWQFGAQVVRVRVWNAEQLRQASEELPPLVQVDLLVPGNQRVNQTVGSY